MFLGAFPDCVKSNSGNVWGKVPEPLAVFEASFTPVW